MEIIIKDLGDLNLALNSNQLEDLFSKEEIKMIVEMIFTLAGYSDDFINRVLNCLNESFKLSKKQFHKFYRKVKNGYRNYER